MMGLQFNNCSTSNKEFAILQKSLFYTGILLPFYGFEYTKKKKQVTAVQHILAESLKQSNEVQKFVNTQLQALREIQYLLQHFQDPVAEVNADQKYAMGLCLRNIGDNYYSVSLLKVAMDYVEQHPGQMSHQEIDFNLLSALMKKHEILN